MILHVVMYFADGIIELCSIAKVRHVNDGSTRAMQPPIRMLVRLQIPSGTYCPFYVDARNKGRCEKASVNGLVLMRQYAPRSPLRCSFHTFASRQLKSPDRGRQGCFSEHESIFAHGVA
jgi:hypothetical protein